MGYCCESMLVIFLSQTTVTNVKMPGKEHIALWQFHIAIKSQRVMKNPWNGVQSSIFEKISKYIKIYAVFNNDTLDGTSKNYEHEES